MMQELKRVLITGATGFIGKHYVDILGVKGVQVIRATRDARSAKSEDVLLFDLSSPPSVDDLIALKLDAVVHLAWQDLSDYQSNKHLSEYLAQHVTFLNNVISAGIKKLQIFGTCYEYGNIQGICRENQTLSPYLNYAIAKVKLHETLLPIVKKAGVELQWLRLFYVFGSGQRKSSFVPQLVEACQQGKPKFLMSGGEQRFDFILVDEAVFLAANLLFTKNSGIYNLSSGKAIELKELAFKIVTRLNPYLKLHLGHYPYNNWEPMSFYGDNSKLLTDIGLDFELNIDTQLEKFISYGVNFAEYNS